MDDQRFTFATMTVLKKLIFGVMFSSGLLVYAQSKITPQEYIDLYKDYAIIEMHRSGVPASITLAQGMLESSYGNSRLATQGNNHFGIKCKGNWTGASIYADDDAPNECFRAYNTALESFRDHSEFLRANWRYHELFDLRITDYEGWADGLRKAGYATNQSYHTIIISMVKKYNLSEFDLAPLPGEQRILITANEVPMVYAEKGQTMESIAKRNDLSVNQIYKYNDLKVGSKIEEGDIVYLKPKRRRGTEKFHVIEEGEDLYQVSQAYGIKLKHLYNRNRLEEGVEVAAGEKVYMKGKRSKDDTLTTMTTAQKAKEHEYAFINPHSLPIEKAAPIVKEQIVLPEFHIIQSGDNIYRIAEKYHVFEEDILKWNNLNALQLAVGQKIYLTQEGAIKAGKSKPDVKPVVKPDVVKPEVKTTEVKIAETKPTTTTSNTADINSKFHVVEKGETVYRICLKYGISSDQLTAWNNLKGNDIFAGQKLKIAE